MKKEKTKSFISFPPKVKFVKRAQSWCLTSWKEGKQKVEFFAEKPTL